jgi:hypothetical protein
MDDKERIRELEQALRDRNKEINLLRGKLSESRAVVRKMLEEGMRIELYKGEG